MRLFVAVRPPVEAVEHLEAFLEPRRSFGEFRWTDPDQFHVTLAFIPACPDRALEPLVDALAAAAVRIGERPGRITGGGAFPNPTRGKVLYVGLTHRLDDLAIAARSAANHVGAGPDGGPFHPHLTLARTGRPAELTSWIRLLDAYDGPEWAVSSYELVRSHLGEGRRRRPRHEVVAVLGET